MVKVECDGCKAPYQIDEKRIPATGLKMRCPKCGTNLVVMKPEGGAASPGKPSAIGGAPPRPAPPPPRPAPKAPPLASIDDDLIDLPSAMSPGPDLRGPHPGLGFDPPQSAPFSADMPASRRGFGEIDLMVDLPAFGDSASIDVDADFGAQDLPAIHAAPPLGPRFARNITRTPAMDFGEIDLEDAAERIDDGSAMESAFGDVDLPSVQGDAELPSMPGAAIDFPAMRGGQAPFRALTSPSGTFGFGDIDLPVPPGGESAGGFGEMDLPSAADDSDLPMSPDHGAGFGHLDLPLLYEDDARPTPAAALPARAASGLPSPTLGSGLPMASPGSSGLPTPSTAAGLPASSLGPGLPSSAAASFPAAASGSSLPILGSGGALPSVVGGAPGRRSLESHGEFDLGGAREEAPLSSTPRGAFDDSDRAVSTTAGPNMDGAIGLDEGPRSAPVGGEVDLSRSGAVEGPGSLRFERQRPPLTSARSARSGRVRRVALFAVITLAVGGGALALEPSIGPFGINFIRDQLNANTHAAKLEELRAGVQADFDEDTAAAAKRAFAAALAAQVALPRHRPTAAYAAYVALARGLRFGRRSEDDTHAAQLLVTAGADPSAAFALAAQAAGKGEFPQARQRVAELLQRAPKDVDAATLAGEIELAAKAPADAVKAWTQAVALRGDKTSARALFGLARAQAATGDNAAASHHARATFAASPAHAGARTLLASLIWQTPDHEAEALTLLKAVTEDATVRAEASDVELIDAYTLLGRIHLTRSRISAAEQAFAAALKLDPHAVQALIGNGELFYRSGRNSEALARFEAATAADADNLLAKVGVAKTWLALERMREAKDLLKTQRAAHASDPLVAYWLGRTEEALGNPKEAEAIYGEAIKVGGTKPDVVDAYVALAHLLSGAGRTDEAAQKLAEASKQFPELPALHKAQGEVALQTGRYEEARDEFKAALAHDDDLGTRFKFGVALRRTRAFPEAAAVFDAITVVDKDYPGLSLERGLMFEETGQSDKALESYSEALRKAPNDVDLKLRVGSTQVIAGHAEQAEAILREVVKLRPSSAEANHFLGRALLAKGQNQAEAMKYLEAAVNIDGNRAEYHLYVGWAANDTGQPARAETALKKALELDKGLGDAYWQRGILRQKSGVAADALEDLKLALEKRPSRYEAYATMGFCYQDLSRWGEAEIAWHRAIAGNGAIAEWHYRLGKILASHSNVAASGPELALAVKLAEAPGRPAPGWLYDAHLLLAEAVRGRDKPRAIESYRRFLELAPRDSPYVIEAERALASLGAPKPR